MKRIAIWRLFFLGMSLVGGEAQGLRLAAEARKQVGLTLRYDADYRRISYPNGDVPIELGCCTDVVIRACRSALGLDLQKAVHEDILQKPQAYRKLLSRPDRNIDHRRVATLWVYFKRFWTPIHPSSQKSALSVQPEQIGAFLPGDLVIWRLPSGRLHIGVVSAGQRHGRPLMIHNIAEGVQEEDVLHEWPMLGQFRCPEPPSR